MVADGSHAISVTGRIQEKTEWDDTTEEEKEHRVGKFTVFPDRLERTVHYRYRRGGFMR
jgi:hypothetical protein